MYKVMIVEDEMLVRMGLMNTVNWEQYGMQVVAAEANGKDAWDSYLRHKPEVVLTDIRMPLMDGMQLISQIRAKDGRCRIVILSCLDDFNLAKSALTLGVSGYILKLSMTEQEMDEILLKIRRELDGIRFDLDPTTGQTEYNATLPKEIAAAVTYMTNHIRSNISLGKVAEQVGLSGNYLSFLFKKHFQITFIEYLTNIRIEKAKELLQDANKKIYEISLETGFKDESYFSRAFKKATGIGPNEYRKRSRGINGGEQSD